MKEKKFVRNIMQQAKHALPDNALTITGEFRCTLCGKARTSLRSIQKHYKKVHKGVKSDKTIQSV